MSGDDLHIEPGAVKSSGTKLTELASTAKSSISAYFNSAAPAAQANPGFATGPALIAFANSVHGQVNSVIDDLSTNGEKVIAAAQNVQSTDSDTANGFNREMASLNGLSKPPVPGQ